MNYGENSTVKNRTETHRKTQELRAELINNEVYALPATEENQTQTEPATSGRTRLSNIDGRVAEASESFVASALALVQGQKG